MLSLLRGSDGCGCAKAPAGSWLAVRSSLTVQASQEWYRYSVVRKVGTLNSQESPRNPVMRAALGFGYSRSTLLRSLTSSSIRCPA